MKALLIVCAILLLGGSFALIYTLLQYIIPEEETNNPTPEQLAVNREPTEKTTNPSLSDKATEEAASETLPEIDKVKKATDTQTIPPATLKKDSQDEAFVLKRGQAIYMHAGAGGGLCFTCHQPTGLGLPKAHFPPLAGSERVLGDKEILIKIMMHGLMGPSKVNGKEFGHVSMPPPGIPPGSLTDQQIADVLTYIRNAWGNSASAVAPTEVAAVRKSLKGRATMQMWTIAELEKADIQSKVTQNSGAPASNSHNKGLIAYYPFNGNARDATGNGYDGTVIGATLCQDRHGKQDSAYQFNLGNHIKIDGLLGKPENVTLSAWINLDGQQGRIGSEIISLGDKLLLRADNKSIYTQRVGSGGVFFAGQNFWIHNMAKVNYVGTGWHQILFTFDDHANKQVTYVDGQQVASKQNMKSIVYEGSGLNTFIGIHGRTQRDNWKTQGVIDDIRVYDRALDKEEVKELFLTEKPESKLQAGKVITPLTIGELRAKAEAGDFRAQFQMGMKAMNGTDGLKRKPSVAEKWWQRAAEQGHAYAQMNLGTLYSRGTLGEKNPAKAYRWAKLSLQSGNQRAKQLVEELEGELTREQITAAEIFVKAFKPISENAGKTQAANAPRTRTGAIRTGLPNYPRLTPNTDPKMIKFDTVILNRTSVKYEDLWYDGFRYKMPKEGGGLVWAFRGPIKSWYIMPVKGRMNGFRTFSRYNLKRNIPPLGKTGDRVYLQTLSEEFLKADEEYVIWFSFTKRIPVPVYISLNVFADDSPGVKVIAEALEKTDDLINEPAEGK